MNAIKIADIFPDLNFIGARESGLEVRPKIEQALNSNDKVILDFNKIDLVTQSFADEVIGVIIRNKGLSFVENNIEIINANKTIIAIINFVKKYSDKMFRKRGLMHFNIENTKSSICSL
ncbi:MAG: STAS-like domain-containing protein [Deltaproteobacteria bacterium]|nr:STAS-like domain-containing protein [Deltaproteobacteria bacterium]